MLSLPCTVYDRILLCLFLVFLTLFWAFLSFQIHSNVQNGFYCLLRCLVGIVQPKADPWCCLHFTKYKFNVYRKKYIRSGRDSAVVGIVGKSKSLDFLKMLIFWSLVRNSVVLAVYLLFSVACFFTVHEHFVLVYFPFCNSSKLRTFIQKTPQAEILTSRILMSNLKITKLKHWLIIA